MAKLLQIRNGLKEIALDTSSSIMLESDEDFDRPMGEIGIDSLDTMTILLDAQERFGIEIPDEDIEKLPTLSAIALYIIEKQESRKGKVDETG